jgi:class 3 adenylate cyclase
MQPALRYVRTKDGVSIAYAVFGQGPLVVYASTIWGSLHMIQEEVLGRREQLTDLLDLGWSVAIYDCRGTGASEREVDDFSLAARLRDLEAVVGQLGAERFALAGEFLGTPVALEYAVRFPERVSHLILANPFASGAASVAPIPAMGLITAMRDMTEGQWEFFTQSLASAITMFRDAGEVQAVAGMMRRGMLPGGFGAFRDAAATIDLTDRLPLVEVPTLVVRDESLPFSSASLARAVASSIPDAQLVVTFDLAIAIAEFVSGQPVSRQSPPEVGTALRTILFTDIVDHTEMMQRLGDAKGRDVLREHERITRETLKQHGGAEVKTMGDGFMASFWSVTSAMECAIALQRAFAVHTEAAPEPLHVRVGLNAGEPIEEGGDLFGATVILASRIAATAGAGEILVPETVRGLLSGKGFLFGDWGDFIPKGFDEGVRLWHVRWQE